MPVHSRGSVKERGPFLMSCGDGIRKEASSVADREPSEEEASTARSEAIRRMRREGGGR